MDLLKLEIAKKKNSLSDLPIVGTLSTGTKYLKLSDRKELEKQKLLEIQLSLNEERKLKELDALKAKEASNIIKSDKSINNIKSDAEKLLDKSSAILLNVSKLSTVQVKNKLRAAGHPITLFGESDEDRRKRLIDVLVNQDDHNDDNYLK
jgi:pre-mRNA-splicing factor 18